MLVIVQKMYCRISNGNTLFYPCGMWSLYEADLSDFGDTKDIRFVPMPRCPYADEYYLPTGLEAYSLCKGAQNPEGVAAFLNCGRITRNDDTAKEISKKQLFEDYKWSEEMAPLIFHNMQVRIQEMILKWK